MWHGQGLSVKRMPISEGSRWVVVASDHQMKQGRAAAAVPKAAKQPVLEDNESDSDDGLKKLARKIDSMCDSPPINTGKRKKHKRNTVPTSKTHPMKSRKKKAMAKTPTREKNDLNTTSHPISDANGDTSKKESTNSHQ